MGSKSESKNTKVTFIYSFGCGLLLVTTLVTVTAIVCTIAAVVIHQSTLATSNYKIEVAKRRITELEKMMNDSTKTLRVSAQQQALNVQTRIDQLNSRHQTISSNSDNEFNKLNSRYSTSYNELIQNVQHLQVTIPSRIETAVNDSEVGVETSRMGIEALNVQIDELRLREEELDMRVNLNGSFYNNCTLQVERCYMQNTLTQGFYWHTCVTNYTAMNVEGYQTVHMKCDYASSYDTDLQEAVLRYDKYRSAMFCQCSIAIPDNIIERDNTQFTFRPLPPQLTGTCSLYIRRCPETQSLPRTRVDALDLESHSL